MGSKTISQITETQTVFNDTDYFELQELAGTSKKTLWSTIKSQLKSYFDTLYFPLSSMPVGSSIDFSGTVIPTNWMIEDGSSLLRADYSSLYSALTTNKGTITITSANPGVVSLTAHGLQTGDRVAFTTTGALPTAIVSSTNYYVVYVGTGTFSLATTYANAVAGTKIDTTAGTQSGVHTLTWIPWGSASATTFYLPDTQGISVEGSGTGASAPAYNPWLSSEYAGRLGQYRQDQMQVITGSFKTGANGGLTDLVGAFTGVTSAQLPSGTSGSAYRDITFASSGSPSARTGASTKTPRVGKYKIIKVL